MATPDIASEIPAGFGPMPHMDGFIAHTGPFYARVDAHHKLTYGFHTDKRHGNPNSVIHGATMTLTSNFVAGAKVGQWIEAHVDLRRLSSGHAWLDGELRAGDRVVMTAVALFSVFEPRRWQL